MRVCPAIFADLDVLHGPLDCSEIAVGRRMQPGHGTVRLAQGGGLVPCAILAIIRAPPMMAETQGGVKVPTGGNGERSSKPASARRAISGVSRFGVIPKPTVTVRMEENGKIWRTHAVSSFEARIALILVS